MKSFPIRPASIASCILFFVLLLLITRPLTSGDLPGREVKINPRAQQWVLVSFDLQDTYTQTFARVYYFDQPCFPECYDVENTWDITESPPWIAESSATASCGGLSAAAHATAEPQLLKGSGSCSAVPQCPDYPYPGLPDYTAGRTEADLESEWLGSFITNPNARQLSVSWNADIQDPDTILQMVSVSLWSIPYDDDSIEVFSSYSPYGNELISIEPCRVYTIIYSIDIYASSNGDNNVSYTGTIEVKELIDDNDVTTCEDCTNGIDDNGDGLVDCADPDCPPCSSEVCNNGVDDDGDGLVDCDDPDCFGIGCPEVCTGGLDEDGDGFVDCADPDCAVDNDGDGYFALPCGSDCNDNDANEHPDQLWCKDADDDGYSDGTCNAESCTRPPGYKVFWSELINRFGDCDDNNPLIHPEATEVCNGVDDNCDELIDIGTGNTYYRDADGDGYGDPNSLFKACTQPSGFVSNNSDCNDNNANIHPGAIEVCNVVDDNCNGQIDEGVTKNTYYRDADGDGYGNPNNSIQACTQPSGYVTNNQDCNDGDSSIHPGVPEVCDDSKDNDCDGQVDCFDPDCQVWVDKDMDGCPGPPCGNDCNDNDPFICPSLPEDCLDGKDNNCNGFVDCADVGCQNDLDNDKCFAPPCGQDCKDNDPSSCICPEEVPYKVPSYIDFRRVGVITLPIPRRVRFRDELNLDFCEALREGVEEIALELSGCEPITIPGDRLKSDRLKNRFSARSSSGEIPGYSLNINCKKGLLKLQIWNADLENCVSNPVRTCVTIKDGPSLCAEDEFKEVRDRKGRLKKLVYTGK